MSERVVRANGLEIATDAFGDPSHPPVLLIMAAVTSMLWWPEEFCRRLAGRARHVIRYDNRDTGHSTRFPPGEAPYTVEDMADDAIRVLDGYEILSAHLVGMSIGGIMGQLVGLKYPDRVRTLTVISSTPVGLDKSHLPASSNAFNNHLAAGESVDWSNREAAIEYLVEEARICAGAKRSFDERQVRAFLERDDDRSSGYLSAATNAPWKVGDQWNNRLHELKAPLLVIHGAADPVFPIEHGLALVNAVARAKLVRLEGGGHELHHTDWDTMVDAIVQHTEGGQRP